MISFRTIFHVTSAAAVIIATSPILIVAMWLVRRQSPGPAIFRQTRIGRFGRPFTCYKLRTMYVETPDLPTHEMRQDNVTPIGHKLRRWRVDEIPQLWNALRGDMSMVGPRPERPGFVADLTRQIPFYGQRHVVKPGVTGWAQVRYTYGASVEDALQKLQFDLYYIKNMSVALDIFVMLQTVKTVLLRRGAS